jgi:hypothetical protein
MRSPNKLLKLLIPASLLVLAQLCGAAEAPEEFIVTARVPGAPLWRVSKGDHVMWIFPALSPVPIDLVWETDNIERVIDGAQEVLYLPQGGFGVSGSKLLTLNPVNWVRGYRLVRRLMRNADGKTLDEVLPPELYARYAALKEKYFPRDDDIDELRPLFAGDKMMELIQADVGLAGGGTHVRLGELIERNPDIKRTYISTFASIELKGKYRDVAARAETLMTTLPPAQELACFEAQLARMEQVENLRLRAAAWARGNVDEFRSIPLAADTDRVCTRIWATSSEAELFDQQAELSQKWLKAAEAALVANERSVAILSIDELLREDGLVSQLEARGYTVRTP